MADCAFTTKFSRRTILAGTTAAAAFPITVIAIPKTAESTAAPDPDAVLLRRLALVERLGDKYIMARAVRDRLRAVVRDHPEYRGLRLITKAAHEKYDEICRRTGYYDAMLHCGDLFHRYANATRAAIAAPARTPRGILKKLELARKAAKKGDRRVYMYEDDNWLEMAMADLGRLAG